MAAPSSNNYVSAKRLSEVVYGKDGTGGQHVDGLWDKIKQKSDKVSGATSGNFAGLDSNGNLTDSGKKAADFKTVQTAKSSPTASGNTLSFIDTVSQDTNGVITATKKNVTVASSYSGTGTDPINGTGVKAAIDALDSDVTSGDGTNVQVEVTETDGKITAVSITTDNTESKNNKKQSIVDSSTTDFPSSKAVADFVNSSVATNTANYISNNGEPFTSVAQLEAYSGTVTNNDYAFVTGTDTAGNTYYDRYKATVSGSTVTWAKEYRLNNSSFTATQWAAINSGVTTAVVASIDNKVDKVTGKGLSQEDFTTTLKNKLNGIEAGAEVNVQSNWNESDSTKDGFIKNKPTKLSDFTNDLAIDSVPTKNSNNFVKSGGVYDNEQVLVQSVNELKSDIDALNENREEFININTNTIHTMEIPYVGSAPMITSGSGAPSSEPEFVGQVYIDTTNAKLYFAKGVGSSSDWAMSYVKASTGIPSTDMSSAVQTSLSKADVSAADADVVHKAGAETITGVKTFSGDVSPINLSSGSQTHQSRMFKPTFISEYSAWTSAQKDGNHYRQWTIDVTDAIVDKNVTASVFIVMQGSYFNTSANGTLAKLITFRKNATNYINNSQEDYVVAQSPCSTEYVISGLLKESDRFKFKVINKAPANNNYPVNLLIDLTVDTLTNLNTCTLTEEIVEGWPEWAGDKAVTVKVTASGSPVLTEGSLSNYKTKQSAVSVTGGTLKGVASMTQDANGVVSLTLNDIQDGTTSQKGAVQLEDSHTSTSTTKAATPKNVKEAYDLANSAVHDSSYVHTDNNFTNSYKSQVDSNTSARHTHSNKTVLDGISSTDVSNWNAKASDSDVVHKAGAETITGIKTFNNDVSSRQTGDSFAKQSKVFACSVITPYAGWTASQKDGNHYRTWTIDLTSAIVTASTHGNVVVKMMGSYYNTAGNGALQKEITFQVHSGDVITSKDDYIVAQAPCSEEFAISGIFKSESSYFVQVANKKPTENNYPLRLEIEMFNRNTSAVLDNVTMTEAITEGWPSWAGDKNTPAKVTATGSPVLTEATAAAVAKTGSYSDLSGKPTSVGNSMRPVYFDANGQAVACDEAGYIEILNGPQSSYTPGKCYLI